MPPQGRSSRAMAQEQPALVAPAPDRAPAPGPCRRTAAPPPARPRPRRSRPRTPRGSGPAPGLAGTAETRSHANRFALPPVCGCHLRWAPQRQVAGVAGHQHARHRRLGGQAALDQPRPRRPGRGRHDGRPRRRSRTAAAKAAASPPAPRAARRRPAAGRCAYSAPPPLRPPPRKAVRHRPAASGARSSQNLNRVIPALVPSLPPAIASAQSSPPQADQPRPGISKEKRSRSNAYGSPAPYLQWPSQTPT